MMPNNALLIMIIVGVIALIVGAIAGYLGGFLENRLNKSLDEAREITDPNDPNYEKQKPVPNVDEHDILKVTIDPSLQLHLALDGIRVLPDELTPDQRTRLVNVIVQIRPWIDGKVSPAAVAAVTSLPVSEPVPPLAPSSFPISMGIQPTSKPAARVDVKRGFLSLLESDVKKPEPLLQNNIIALIDEVLQRKLESSPLVVKRIRLEEGALGDVVVYVGATRYDGVASVPDEAIRAIIQESIQEWNSR